jgi:hypothetical protein
VKVRSESEGEGKGEGKGTSCLDELVLLRQTRVRVRVGAT